MSPAAFSGWNLFFSHLLRRSAARTAQRAISTIQSIGPTGLEAWFYVSRMADATLRTIATYSNFTFQPRNFNSGVSPFGKQAQ